MWQITFDYFSQFWISVLNRSDPKVLSFQQCSDGAISGGRWVIGGAAILNLTRDPTRSIRLVSNFCLWWETEKEFVFQVFCVIFPFAVDPNARDFWKKTSIFLPAVQVLLLALLKISPLAQFYSVFFCFFWLSLDLCGIVCQFGLSFEPSCALTCLERRCFFWKRADPSLRGGADICACALGQSYAVTSPRCRDTLSSCALLTSSNFRGPPACGTPGPGHLLALRSSAWAPPRRVLRQTFLFLFLIFRNCYLMPWSFKPNFFCRGSIKK